MSNTQTFIYLKLNIDSENSGAFLVDMRNYYSKHHINTKLQHTTDVTMRVDINRRIPTTRLLYSSI